MSSKKPPFLESECKVLYDGNMRRLSNLMEEINELVEKLNNGEYVEVRLNGLFNEASGVAVQIRHYKEWLEWYNGHKTV